jgi:hypothetical protein
MTSHNSISMLLVNFCLKLRIISFALRIIGIKWWNPSNACQKCTIDICHIQTSKMSSFWLRSIFNFNRKFTNFPLFHPSVNRHLEIFRITSFPFIRCRWLARSTLTNFRHAHDGNTSALADTKSCNFYSISRDHNQLMKWPELNEVLYKTKLV